jgi:hypothetical protein
MTWVNQVNLPNLQPKSWDYDNHIESISKQIMKPNF